MFKERLEKVVEDIQLRNKDLSKFQSLLSVCDPGKTNFKPKSIGESGYVLLCPFTIKTRKRAVHINEAAPTDYMGVSPFMMVVMESGSSICKAGDIVLIDPDAYKTIDRNFVIIKSAIAYYMPDSIIQGVERDITTLVEKEKLLNH